MLVYEAIYETEELKKQKELYEKNSNNVLNQTDTRKELIKLSGCINRDTNATKNMELIVKNYLKTNERLINFRR